MATAALVNNTLTPTIDRQAQQQWATTPLCERLRILSKARALIAANPAVLVDAISPNLARTRADSLVAEVLPLLAACKFLEQNATQILMPRHLGRRGLPFWLAGVDTTLERVPCGTILIIGPANYPLFLPGVQALQALAAGNAVTWKPGLGGEPVARALAAILQQAGLPTGVLEVTDESVAAAEAAIAAHPDKIIFTGSATAGKAVLHAAADLAIPVIAELSGCDAVFVFPTADSAHVVEALTFGLRLNGSATCMAPRRLILISEEGYRAELDTPLLQALEASLARLSPIPASTNLRAQLTVLLEDAEAKGATIAGRALGEGLKPILILNGTPDMAVTQTDVFAPILTILHAQGLEEAIALHEACPFALTASIFGEEQSALALSRRITAGTVILNDLIVPTADPRIPFGGRKGSGFGLTRGTEGLLEMTAVKTTAIRRGKDRRHYEATGPAHEELFTGVVAMGHSSKLGQCFVGLRRVVKAAMNLKEKL